MSDISEVCDTPRATQRHARSWNAMGYSSPGMTLSCLGAMCQVPRSWSVAGVTRCAEAPECTKIVCTVQEMPARVAVVAWRSRSWHVTGPIRPANAPERTKTTRHAQEKPARVAGATRSSPIMVVTGIIQCAEPPERTKIVCNAREACSRGRRRPKSRSRHVTGPIRRANAPECAKTTRHVHKDPDQADPYAGSWHLSRNTNRRQISRDPRAWHASGAVSRS